MYSFMDCNSREITLRMTYEQAYEICSCLPLCDTKKEFLKTLEISSRKNKKFHQDLLTLIESCDNI